MASTRSILIVDDSPAYRHQIRLAIESIEGLKIAGEASDGKSALQFLKFNHVDCITLDVEMPGMDGIEVVSELRKSNRTCRIIMLSSLTTKGAAATLKALSAGADDFIGKPIATEHPPNLTPSQIIRSVLEPKLHQFLQTGAVQSTNCGIQPLPMDTKPFDWRLFKPKIIVIGSSTGGPAALEQLFTHIHWPLLCPVIIAQHMPALFTKALADRLSVVVPQAVREATDGQVLAYSDVFIAPGDFHLKIENISEKKILRLNQGPQRNFVRPCIDYLFESAASVFGERCMGIVLTGMGSDGKDGAAAIKAKHGAIALQDKNSCVVYGMPAAVFESGNYDYSGELKDIGALINRVAK